MSGNISFFGGILAMLLAGVCVIYDMHYLPHSATADNIFGAFLRVPSFCIGMGIAPLVKKNVSMNWLFMIVMALISYISLHHYFPHSNFPVLLAIPLLIVFTLGLRYFDTKGFSKAILTFMGIISLESYLTNVFFGGIFHRISWGAFAYGNYIPYLCVVISGICCSIIVNRWCKHYFK